LVAKWYELSRKRNVKFRLHWGKEWVTVNDLHYVDYLKKEMGENLNQIVLAREEPQYDQLTILILKS